jgi:hypothetical protein
LILAGLGKPGGKRFSFSMVGGIREEEGKKMVEGTAKTLGMAFLALIIGCGIGMGIQSGINGDKLQRLKEGLVRNIELQCESVRANFSSYIDETEAIADEYPDMTAQEKALFLKSNERFYQAIRSGAVIISPLQMPFFFADNAGNNPIVTNFVERYNELSNDLDNNSLSSKDTEIYMALGLYSMSRGVIATETDAERQSYSEYATQVMKRKVDSIMEFKRIVLDAFEDS